MIAVKWAQWRPVAATEEPYMKATHHSWKLLVWLFVCSLGITLFTARVAAQDEVWRIMRADYGFRNQRTDVTDILRDLIGRGGVNGNPFRFARFILTGHNDIRARRSAE